jgi:hypothetical protein
MVEVIIGTARNGKSIIKRNQKTVNEVEVTTPDVLHKGEFTVFKITWVDHVIEVFKDDEEKPFMSFAMVEKFDVKYFGIETP